MISSEPPHSGAVGQISCRETKQMQRKHLKPNRTHGESYKNTVEESALVRVQHNGHTDTLGHSDIQ